MLCWIKSTCTFWIAEHCLKRKLAKERVKSPSQYCLGIRKRQDQHAEDQPKHNILWTENEVQALARIKPETEWSSLVCPHSP